MRCHNLLHNIEAKPASPRLCGIQGLENLRELRGRDATPSISHVELDMCGRTLARQCERAALRQGVQSILHEVEHGATQRTRMQGYGAQLL